MQCPRLRRGSSATVALRVGYACVNTQLPTSARTLRLANITPDRVCALVESNLDALEAILSWNDEHGIQVFRLTSNLVPFGSHEANRVAWWEPVTLIGSVMWWIEQWSRTGVPPPRRRNPAAEQ